MKIHLWRSIISRIVACLLMLLALASTTLPAAASTRSNEADFAQIDTYVSSHMQAMRLPGLAMGIVHGDQIVHLHGFGQADQSGRTVTTQTPFVIGSMTKSFTALAIMQLVEAGKMQLNAPVQRYLPWFRVADPTASTRITVRNLLNQTSGIPTSAGVAFLAEQPGTLEQQVRNLSKVALTQPVGKTFQYSNSNYATLGLIIEAVSGQTYGAYIQQHILDPLSMKHSFATERDARQAGLAQGYHWLFGYPVPVNEVAIENLRVGIASMLAGHVPPSGPNLSTSYLIIDSVVLLISILVLLSALRLPHWYKKFSQRRGHRLLRVGLRLMWELVLPVVLLISVPIMFGTWSEFSFTFPDLGPWLIVTLAVLVITAITRVVLVVLALRRKDTDRPVVIQPVQSQTPSLT